MLYFMMLVLRLLCKEQRNSCTGQLEPDDLDLHVSKNRLNICPTDAYVRSGNTRI